MASSSRPPSCRQVNFLASELVHRASHVRPELVEKYTPLSVRAMISFPYSSKSTKRPQDDPEKRVSHVRPLDVENSILLLEGLILINSLP